MEGAFSGHGTLSPPEYIFRIPGLFGSTYIGIYSSRYARTAVIGTRYVRKAVGAAGGAVGPVDTAIGIIRTYCSKCSAWIQ